MAAYEMKAEDNHFFLVLNGRFRIKTNLKKKKFQGTTTHTCVFNKRAFQVCIAGFLMFSYGKKIRRVGRNLFSLWGSYFFYNFFPPIGKRD